MRISSWRNEHPITSYLRVPLLGTNNGVVFSSPLWAFDIINSEEGAFVVAGEHRGIRSAAVGIELLPFEGARTPSPSILTLNLLRWLQGGATITKEYLTGMSYRLHGDTAWSIATPENETQNITVEKEDLSFLDLTTPGIYKVQATSTTTQTLVEDNTLAINAFHQSEMVTNTRDILRVLPNQESSTKKSSQIDSTELWRYLLIGALLFIMLDLTLYATRGKAA